MPKHITKKYNPANKSKDFKKEEIIEIQKKEFVYSPEMYLILESEDLWTISSFLRFSDILSLKHTCKLWSEYIESYFKFIIMPKKDKFKELLNTFKDALGEYFEKIDKIEKYFNTQGIKNIREVIAFNHPPNAVLEVIEILFIFLNEEKYWKEHNSWTEIRNYLKKNVWNVIYKRRAEHITYEIISRINEKLFKNENLNYESIKTINVASGELFLYIMNTIEMRRKFDQLNLNINQYRIIKENLSLINIAEKGSLLGANPI